MQIAYTHDEARKYLGLGYEAFRQLTRQQGISSEINPDDHRIKLYRAEDVERLKFRQRRTRQTDLITVLQADYAPQFCEQLGRQLARHMGERIAVVRLLAPTEHTYVHRFPTCPMRRLVDLDLYQLTPGEGPRATQPNYLQHWKRLQSWLIALAQRYPKVLILVAAASPFTDLVLLSSTTVCVVVKPDTTKSVREKLQEVEANLLAVNELRHDHGVFLDAMILAGLTGCERDLRVRRHVKRRVAPRLLVANESRAVSELLRHWYGRQPGSSPSSEESGAANATAAEGSEPAASAPATPLPAAPSSEPFPAGGDSDARTAHGTGAQADGERPGLDETSQGGAESVGAVTEAQARSAEAGRE